MNNSQTTARNLKLAAAITTAPRYVNLAILADGGNAFWHSEWWYSVIVAIAGAGFAIVEVWSAAYIINATGRAKGFRAIAIWAFWIAILATLAMSVGGALYNLILEVDVKDWQPWLYIPWLVSTAVAPFMIFGGVGLASKQMEQDSADTALQDIESQLKAKENELQSVKSELQSTEYALEETCNKLEDAVLIADSVTAKDDELQGLLQQLEIEKEAHSDTKNTLQDLRTKYAALESGDKKQVAIWISSKFADIPKSAIAKELGVSNSTVGNWVNGKAQ